MIDFSNFKTCGQIGKYPIVTYKDGRYLIKYNYYEHVSSVLYRTIYPNVHYTFPCIYNEKLCVACKVFCHKNEYFVPFSSLIPFSDHRVFYKNRKAFYKYVRYVDKKYNTNLLEQFFICSILDSLFGVHDRINNTGLIMPTSRVAPVFDNATCFYFKSDVNKINLLTLTVQDILSSKYSSKIDVMLDIMNEYESVYFSIIHRLRKINFESIIDTFAISAACKSLLLQFINIRLTYIQSMSDR